MHLLLVGNYGVGNLGDEALKDYFLQAFPEHTWTVIQAKSHAEPFGSTQDRLRRSATLHVNVSSLDYARDDTLSVPRLPLGLRSVFRPWWRTLQAVRHCDAVVFGGGSLLTDTESVFACILWWWHAAVARLFCRPIFLAFQGVGPFRTRVGEWCARWVIRHSIFLSVRDPQSAARIERWNMNKKIVLSFDPVLKTLLKNGFNKRENTSSNKLFIIIPRRNSGSEFFQNVMKKERFEKIRILSLQSEDPKERETCVALAKHTGADVMPISSLDHLLKEIAAADCVLSERYHGALAAFALGVPFDVVPQELGDKLDSLTKTERNEALGLVEEGEQALRSALLTVTRQ